MAVPPDIWLTLEQWKADNQKWNNLPRWQLDQFSETPQSTTRKSDRALVWIGRNLTTLGIWLQNRYGDTCCLIEIEANNPQAQTSRG